MKATLYAMLGGALSLIGALVTLAMTMMRAGNFVGCLVVLIITGLGGILMGVMIDASSTAETIRDQYKLDKKQARELQTTQLTNEQRWLETPLEVKP